MRHFRLAFRWVHRRKTPFIRGFAADYFRFIRIIEA
jgi:hypothetical protein